MNMDGWWSDTERREKDWEKICTNATLSTTNLILICHGSNPRPRSNMLL